MDDYVKLRLNLSLVVPFISDLQVSDRIIHSYLNSGIVNEIRIQFVFLGNRKNPPFGLELNSINIHETHDVVYVGNDRFFSSAEENIYRMRDFLDILNPWVLIIGETDEIVWGNLVQAIQLAQKSQLDALLLNVENRQPKHEGGFSSQNCAIKLNNTVFQNSIVQYLMDGHMIGSNIGYTSILSMYGPVDWLSFIGSHIFSRSALQGILKYRFVEHIYSFVYMQAQYFTERPRNYQLFMSPVVIRISNDFANNPSVNEKGGESLREHRAINGHSKVFGAVHFYHLLQIENDDLFNVIIGSMGLAHIPKGNNEISFYRNSFLRSLLLWGIQLLDDKFIGRSFYFADIIGISRFDQDIWSFTRYLGRVLEINDRSDRYLDQDLIEKFRDALILLNSYFAIGCQSLAILQRIRLVLNRALGIISEEIIRGFHDLSFRGFYKSLS